ncbi:MAG: hypothetical protein IT184_15610 [Acidobacteria bacterium]|nr:hypothetical protein [Acidobacteriota bacterium]
MDCRRPYWRGAHWPRLVDIVASAVGARATTPGPSGNFS